MPRIPDSVKNPGEILSGRGAIGRLYRQARDRLELQDHIREVVPGEIYVAAFDQGVLHLVTPSAALATRLRYQQRRFIGKLALDGQAVSGLKVSVRPEMAQRYEPAPREPRAMSRETAKQVADAARHIDDEGLREAIIRLSSRGSDSSEER